MILSHSDTYDYIKDNPSQDLVLPDMKWVGDRFDITLGDTQIEHGMVIVVIVVVAVEQILYWSPSYLPDLNQHLLSLCPTHGINDHHPVRRDDEHGDVRGWCCGEGVHS